MYWKLHRVNVWICTFKRLLIFWFSGCLLLIYGKSNNWFQCNLGALKPCRIPGTCSIIFSEKKFQIYYHFLVDVYRTIFMMSCFTWLNWKFGIYFDFRCINSRLLWMDVTSVLRCETILLTFLYVNYYHHHDNIFQMNLAITPWKFRYNKCD